MANQIKEVTCFGQIWVEVFGVADYRIALEINKSKIVDQNVKISLNPMKLT